MELCAAAAAVRQLSSGSIIENDFSGIFISRRFVRSHRNGVRIRSISALALDMSLDIVTIVFDLLHSDLRIYRNHKGLDLTVL